MSSSVSVTLNLANLFLDSAEAGRMRLFMRYQNAVQREYDKAFKEFQELMAKVNETGSQEAWRQAMQLAGTRFGPGTEAANAGFGVDSTNRI